ncbi:hypothetical protein [Herbiconiux sp. A18JL235]|uniref:DUF222 domain-containing protein n=1 Tax=Herbiconiux sp. A18JL235 TaxID=3152363 RepID=A0AB39BIY9_9MICO
MIGWRRKAKAVRESAVSQERLYELVNQTLMENFGPLGSFAITRRTAVDTDDIFHTALARSVAHDIVANLAEHGIVVSTAAGERAAAAAAVAAASAPRAGASFAATGSTRSTRPWLAPVESVPVHRDLARAVSAATRSETSLEPAARVSATARPAPATEIPAYPTTAHGVVIGERPLIDGPDPLDDDAMRSLVAHHHDVEAAVAEKAARTIAI